MERLISTQAHTTTDGAGATPEPNAVHPLDRIFHPRATAVVGVSSRPDREGNMGGNFLNALLDQDYGREHALYAVNPKMEEVRGVRCYPTLLDCPDPVDHVISQIPVEGLPGLIDQCIAKGVRSIHSYTAGLSETGDADLARVEREIIAKLRAAGIRLIGPNCMGLYVPGVGLSFMQSLPKEPGNVMMMSQSGANANVILRGLGQRGLRFSKGVSYGNGADLQVHELIDYALADPQSEYVVGYIEGVRNGPAFVEALKRLAAVKPTILLKGGITADGARAANSHTGSLAGSIQIFEAVCRQAGAWRAERMDELLDLATVVTSAARGVKGRNVTLIGSGGGFAVLSTDQLALAGLRLPPLPEEVQNELREFIPIAGTSVRNPVDATFGRDRPLDFAGDRENTVRMFEVIANSHSTDVIFTTVGGWRRPGRDAGADELARHLRSAVDELAGIQERTGVPVVMIHDEHDVRAISQHAHQRGIALLPTVDRAAKALADLLDWRARREGLPDIL